MAIYRMKQSGHKIYGLIEYLVDTADDIRYLPVDDVPGSSAICLGNGKTYYITENGDWKEMPLNSDQASKEYVDGKISDLIGSAPETLDTLKEIVDHLDNYATQVWVEEKGYLTEHQDISGKQDVIADLDTIRAGAALGATSIQEHQDISNKLNKLPNVEDENDPGYGYPYWIPYNFEFTPQADKMALTLHTLTLDNNFLKMDFNKDIPVATITATGFMSAADKVKLDAAITEHYTVTIDI